MEWKIEQNSFSKRLKSMLETDTRRIITTPLLYIMVGVCFVMPILILVMTTMMDGTVSTDPRTGKETVIEGFKNVWQIIGSLSSSGSTASSDAAAMDMSITSMCNINMIYFLIAVFVCLFVGDDFRSGYSKNLFAVRSKKTDYVISKTIVLSLGSMLMVFAFFLGSMLGGAVSGLPFEMVGFDTLGIFMCLISKHLLVMLFVPIYLCMSVAFKQKIWLSILLSLGVGMLLFTVAPMVSPLNSTFVNVILCLVGGAAFGIGIGAISKLVLEKTSLV